MKLLTKLEKSKTFWYLLGLSFLFFLLRLPSLIEPNWYGDEGIYQVIGIAMNKGRLLYAQIWDNKPPLLYLVYAFFHGDQFQVRLFFLFSGLFATWGFFNLAKLLFKQLKASLISSILFVLLFATPLLEGNIANAENFILPLTITAGFLIYIASSKNQNPNFSSLTSHLSFPIAGFLLGLAFLFKIVAIFDFAAFFVFLVVLNFPERFRLSLPGIKTLFKTLVKPLYPLILGFVIPILLTGLYFLSQNAFSDFLRAAFSSNIGYVGWKNNFIVPQGFLILKLTILALFSCFIFWKRKHINKSTMFVLLWFAFSLFNTFFSGRPYTHYTLVTIPSLCLLVGLLFISNKKREQFIFLLILVFGIFLLNTTFKPSFKKVFRYYGNALSFLMNKKDVVSYQSFFDQKTPRDYAIASFIKTHTRESDNVFIWGDSAQIYVLSEKLPPGKYTVSYHINQYKSGLSQTQADLERANPKYIITLPEARVYPFHLSTYRTLLVFRDVVIYERSF